MYPAIRTENIAMTKGINGGTLGSNFVSFNAQWKNENPIKVIRYRCSVVILYPNVAPLGTDIKCIDLELSRFSVVNVSNGNNTYQNWDVSGTQNPATTSDGSTFSGPMNNNYCDIVVRQNGVFRLEIPLQQILNQLQPSGVNIVAAMNPIQVSWYLNIDYIEL